MNNQEKTTVYISSKIGGLEIQEDGGKIIKISLNFAVQEYSDIANIKSQNLSLCVKEIQAYLDGKLKHFSFAIKITGTEFEQKVYRELQTISYGKTANYGEIAEIIGNKNASRAVGRANSKNPLLLVVPCHRIVGKNSIGGFSQQGVQLLNIKRYLLELESSKI